MLCARQERVTLDDATAESRFSADPYLRERQARSILCEPLITQTKLVGVLYLENKRLPAFSRQPGSRC